MKTWLSYFALPGEPEFYTSEKEFKDAEDAAWADVRSRQEQIFATGLPPVDGALIGRFRQLVLFRGATLRRSKTSKETTA